MSIFLSKRSLYSSSEYMLLAPLWSLSTNQISSRRNKSKSVSYPFLYYPCPPPLSPRIFIFLAMQPYIHQFANFLRLHMDSIAVGLVATFLIIYGGKINGYFKKITKSIPFVARFALFVVLCSAGYAFLTSQMVKYLKTFLRAQPDLPLIGIIAGAFLVLAFLARSGKDI